MHPNNDQRRRRYSFQIREIIINDDSKIQPGQINVIVGPNSCGKSRLLKDIRDLISNPNNKSTVIKKLEYQLPDNIEEFLSKYNLPERVYNVNGQLKIRNYSGIKKNYTNLQESYENILATESVNLFEEWKDALAANIAAFSGKRPPIPGIESGVNDVQTIDGRFVKYTDPDGQERLVALEEWSGVAGAVNPDMLTHEIENFLITYGQLFFNYLGTEERLMLCKMQKRFGVNDWRANFLSEVRHDTKLLEELSNKTKTLFHKDIYLDKDTLSAELIFRVGEDFSFIRNAKHDDSEAESQLIDCPTLDDEGDGLKSFVANFLALKMEDKDILLLDEPESFLHPPLAKQLGKIIGESARSGRQIFIATHSADLLKGIINSGQKVKILRVTRSGNLNRIKELDDKTIGMLKDDGLISSPRVLSGLFCEKVYICEAESDEELFRLLHDKGSPYDSAVFLSTHGKDNFKRVANFYKNVGVQYYCIYDFDIMHTGFNTAISNIGLVAKTETRYKRIANEVRSRLAKKQNYYIAPLNLLNGLAIKEELIEMMTELKRNGIIILKSGCLESALVDMELPYSTNKKKWFVDAIQRVNNLSEREIKKSDIFKWIFTGRQDSSE